MKVLVIGGGMSGLTYGIIAAKNGFDVTIAERNNRVGKKIAMTGNGKCNIGNADVNASCFNKSNIVRRVLEKISVDEYKRYLSSCGILTFTDELGRMYPLSESAFGVVDCLRYQFEKYGGKTVFENVTLCRIKDGKYEVKLNGTYQSFDKLILCCGSGSQADFPQINGIVGNQYFTQTCPSLTPVKIIGIDPILNGVRAKCVVNLFDGEMPIDKQIGEVQFKDYGLSGICIFNLSATIARRQIQGKNGLYSFVLDLVPNISQWDLADILYLRLQSGYPADKLFYGILHNKLAESVMKRCDDKTKYVELARIAKNFTLNYSKLLDWSMSQVTAGGIDERYVDLETLSLPNGIVALGEVLNVDGICGGNNLYFAAASALSVFTSEQREYAYKLI